MYIYVYKSSGWVLKRMDGFLESAVPRDSHVAKSDQKRVVLKGVKCEYIHTYINEYIYTYLICIYVYMYICIYVYMYMYIVAPEKIEKSGGWKRRDVTNFSIFKGVLQNAGKMHFDVY